MPNDLFRDRVINQILTAVSESSNARRVEHPSLQGRVREIALDHLFRPLLPFGLEIGTGKVIDNGSYQSRQIDLIIYSRSILPSLMYSESEGMFPAESCFYAIEVKSRTSASEIRDAIAKADSLRRIRYLPGAYDSESRPKNHRFTPIIPAFFAFDSDLRKTGKSELERYQELDPNFRNKPSLVAICVVGRGYWYYRAIDKKWISHPPTPDYDEVVDFLSGVINTIPDAMASRGHPRLGNYLMLPRNNKIE